MHDVPPPEAFEPAPDEPDQGGTFRRRLQIAIVLILVASLVILAAVEGGGYIIRGDDEPPAPSGPAPRLAMVDAAGALVWVDEAGQSPVAYAIPGLAFQFPAWSPDGSRIAAIGSTAGATGVYVFRARASTDPPSEPDVIYESAGQPPFYLYWTPDGGQLTFLTTEAAGLALRIAPSDGNDADSIVRTGAPMYWDFVDPARLLVHSGPAGPDGFFAEVGPDGAPFQGTDRAAGVFRAPSVSAGGRYRAYLAAGDDSVGEVVRESRDGSGATRIRVFGTAAMTFNPAGDDLAFIALHEPTNSTLPLPIGPLRVLRPDASEPRTVHAGSVIAFFWSPTGREIAVLKLRGIDDDTVTEAGVGGTVLARASVTAPAVSVPAVSAPAVSEHAVSVPSGPTGSGRADDAAAGRADEAVAGILLDLAFVEVASGAVVSERAVRLSDLFINQVLPFFDQYALSHRFWSPDGRAIALPLVGAGDVTQITVIPADGSEPHVVANGDIGFWSR
jgi:TolB protein